MKINLKSYILVFFILILTCVLPFATYAQQSSASATAKVRNAVLFIGDHAGIDEVDAQSAAILIAAEFRKLGIAVSEPVYKAPQSGNVYRVTFRRLGEKILVHLSQENPPGTVIVEKQLWIANIEEIIQAAPRLVDALVNDKPIDSNVDMESVTEHEAAKLNKMTGESLWNIGIFGVSLPGTDVVGEPGWEFGWSYETPKYAVGTEFRFSSGDSADDDFMFTSWSIGGRYFFNNKNISPYVGGGFSIFRGEYHNFNGRNSYDYYDYYYADNDSGLGAYVVGGVSMLRLTKSRLKLELRVDRPFFSLPNQDMMPISIGIFFSQHYVPGRSGCWWF
ncbi:hypothetical protein J4G08_16870 [Candidatus Poribacteria bacterium]|nr:hypothetical protein [Candidatus Poribacteria bacterium]